MFLIATTFLRVVGMTIITFGSLPNEYRALHTYTVGKFAAIVNSDTFENVFALRKIPAGTLYPFSSKRAIDALKSATISTPVPTVTTLPAPVAVGIILVGHSTGAFGLLIENATINGKEVRVRFGLHCFECDSLNRLLRSKQFLCL